MYLLIHTINSNYLFSAYCVPCTALDTEVKEQTKAPAFMEFAF